MEDPKVVELLMGKSIPKPAAYDNDGIFNLTSEYAAPNDDGDDEYWEREEYQALNWKAQYARTRERERGKETREKKITNRKSRAPAQHAVIKASELAPGHRGIRNALQNAPRAVYAELDVLKNIIERETVLADIKLTYNQLRKATADLLCPWTESEMGSLRRNASGDVPRSDTVARVHALQIRFRQLIPELRNCSAGVIEAIQAWQAAVANASKGSPATGFAFVFEGENYALKMNRDVVFLEQGAVEHPGGGEESGDVLVQAEAKIFEWIGFSLKNNPLVIRAEAPEKEGSAPNSSSAPPKEARSTLRSASLLKRDADSIRKRLTQKLMKVAKKSDESPAIESPRDRFRKSLIRVSSLNKLKRVLKNDGDAFPLLAADPREDMVPCVAERDVARMVFAANFIAQERERAEDRAKRDAEKRARREKAYDSLENVYNCGGVDTMLSRFEAADPDRDALKEKLRSRQEDESRVNASAFQFKSPTIALSKCALGTYAERSHAEAARCDQDTQSQEDQDRKHRRKAELERKRQMRAASAIQSQVRCRTDRKNYIQWKLDRKNELGGAAVTLQRCIRGLMARRELEEARAEYAFQELEFKRTNMRSQAQGAIKIQSAARRHLARKTVEIERLYIAAKREERSNEAEPAAAISKYRAEERAAITIQKSLRGLSRKRAAALSPAAITIQARYRGYVARRPLSSQNVDSGQTSPRKSSVVHYGSILCVQEVLEVAMGNEKDPEKDILAPAPPSFAI